jgi:hypothetical protein
MPKTLYPGLLDFTKEQMLDGVLSPKEIYNDAVSLYDYAGTYKNFISYMHKVKARHFTDVEPEAIISAGDPADEDPDSIDYKFMSIMKKKKIVPGDELCDELECSPEEIFTLINELRERGHEISLDEKNIILSTDVIPEVEPITDSIEEKEIIFGVMSDLHFGSKHVQITAMNEFAEICKKEGVKYIFVPGDVCAGYRVYPGQEFEQYAISAEDQEASVIANLPHGFHYYMLGGNHDYSFFKRGGGHNPLLTLEANDYRNDITYVGFDDADVPILPGVDLKMWHPSGGVPYSISYRMQKGIEQIHSHELVNIVNGVKSAPTIRFFLVGHLHIQMQAMFGGTFGMQCGTFEGQSNYLKKKGLVPAIGGYIVKATLKNNGLMRFEAPFYMFNEIKNDWKNYKHDIENPVITEPIFK